jgi:hypothetical protein
MIPFVIAPNPSSGIININGAQHSTSIQMYNMLGQLCFTAVCEATNTQIDVAHLKDGMYLLKLKDLQTGQMQNYRIDKK